MVSAVNGMQHWLDLTEDSRTTGWPFLAGLNSMD